MEKKYVVIFTICFLFIIFLLIYPFIKSLTKTITGYTTGNVGFRISRLITITSPKNITYNFSLAGYYTIDLNVSANFIVNSWWYTLIDLKHNVIINDSVIFASGVNSVNTTIVAVRWSNKLMVYANDTGNNIYDDNVTFFVYIPNSAPIIEYLPNEIFVCEKSYLSYYFNATDIDEDVPTSDISPKNPFYVAFSYNINLTNNKYEIFSGTLNKNHAGGVNNGGKIYQEIVSVNDNYNGSDSKQINITVIEINNAPSIENTGVQTVWTKGENRSFYKQVQVTDIEDGNQNSGNLTFNITILNSTGSIVNLFNISSNGIINYTSNSSHIGVYNITIYVTDKGIRNPHQNISLCGQNGSNRTSTEYFSLTVTSENRAPTIVNYYPTNLSITANEGERLYFNITMYDPDGTPLDSYWYINGVLVNYNNGVITGGSFAEFYYTFDYDDAGNYSLIARVTDGILNVSFDYVIWNITVLDAEPPPVTFIPGGGGVGGGVAVICDSKWGCDDWSTCRNVEKTLKEGNLFGKVYRELKNNCSKNSLDENFCGFQIRSCSDVNNCSTKPKQEIQICYYTEKPSCNDGIKNCHDLACEVLVDCGGPCLPCPTCSDGIKNQGEEEIDCGGPCPVCPPEKPALFVKESYIIYALTIISTILILIIIIKLIKIFEVKKKIKKIKLENLQEK